MNISLQTYEDWGNQPILHDEDEWGGKYKTYGEMWKGEGYTIGEKKDKTVSLNEVYKKGDLVYYCNACGDIIDPAQAPGAGPWEVGDPAKLPRSARELYENCWGEGCGLPMYVVEYKAETAMAITALFDESYKDDLLTEKGIAVTTSEFWEAVKRVAKMYSLALQYETLVGKNTDPIGHEIVFIIPYKTCENAADIAAFIGDHIYTDFEQECYSFHKERLKKLGVIQ